MFSTINTNEGWNDKVKNSNELAPLGKYIWVVDVNDIFNNSHNYTGTVTLLK